MKKTILTLVFGCCIATGLFAQYIRLNIGYNLPLSSQLIGVSENDTNNPTVEGVYGSYGSGFSFHAAYGLQLGESGLGLDLEAGYLLGKKYESGYYYDQDGIEEEVIKNSSTSFQFAPSLTFATNLGSVQPYTRMGPVLAITKLTESYQYENDSNFEWEYEQESTGGLSVGFKGVLGISFNPGNKIQFFGEMSFLGLSYAPTTREITKYVVNGEDLLDTIPEDVRKVKLEKEIDVDGDENVELRESYSMTSFGFQAGVRLMLGL